MDYALYRKYLAVAIRELRPERSWNIPRLSPLGLKKVACAAARDSGLRDRWRERLTHGYYPEKARLSDEIEEFFAGIPEGAENAARREDAA